MMMMILNILALNLGYGFVYPYWNSSFKFQYLLYVQSKNKLNHHSIFSGVKF